MQCLKDIDQFFKIKTRSIGETNFYLGAKLHPIPLSDGATAWAMSSSKYIQVAVNHVKDYLTKTYPDHRLPKCATAPFPVNYMPKLDVTPKLDNPNKASFYKSHIGILQWCVELGCIDIMTEVSALSSHLASPCEGHLEAVLYIFAYLECWHNACIDYNPNYPNIDMNVFKQCDWKEFYGNVKEALPLMQY